MRPNKDAVLSALEEFDQIGRPAFMEKYGFADRNITYEVEHDGRSYPSKAIFGSAFGFMPGDVARNSETCNGTEASVRKAKVQYRKDSCRFSCSACRCTGVD